MKTKTLITLALMVAAVGFAWSGQPVNERPLSIDAVSFSVSARNASSARP